MDTSSAAAECVTLMAAAGYVVHTFPTGQGNVIGNPILPVIKISGNPRTVRTMSEHIDLDVSGILRREMTISDAGDALIEMVLRTANGRLTAAEALGHREYVLTKLRPRTASARLDTDDRVWWWQPNLAALHSMIEQAGFQILDRGDPYFVPFGPRYERISPGLRGFVRWLRSAKGWEELVLYRRGIAHAAVRCRPLAPRT